MKVLLIHPYITLSDISILQSEPLGLAYLAGYIRERHDVTIVDLFASGIEQRIRIGDKYRIGISSDKKIINIVNKYCPDVIGITSNFTSYAEDSLELADLIATNFPDIFIVLGGAHASMDYQNILQAHPGITCIVRGEGEITFKLLLDYISDGADWKKLDGIAYVHNNNIITNNKRELIADLDLLPLPARDLLEIEQYKKINSLNMPDVKNTPVLTLLTSRGCPFKCIFCSTKVVWERKWRPRSPRLVVDEIETLVRNYGAREVAIYEDQFLANRQRVESICDLIIDRKLDISISIPSGVSGWLLNENLLKK